MNILKLVGIALLINITAKSQNIIEQDLLGTWTGKVTKFSSKNTKMMFDDRTLTLNDNHIFTYDMMKGLSGNWKINKGTVVLESPDFPESIILSEISKDSFVWNLDAMNAQITFYKSNEDKDSASEAVAIAVVDVKRDDLVGEWTNILIEDTKKTKEDNVHLFGGSNDDKLILYKSGEFSLTKSTTLTMAGRIFEGSWSVENGVITFKSKSDTLERLGITKVTKDSFILENMENRYVLMCGETRIRFTHHKVASTE